MNSFSLNSFALNPVPEILFGPGRLADLPKKAEGLAGRGVPLLLVADPALKGLGLTALAGLLHYVKVGPNEYDDESAGKGS